MQPDFTSQEFFRDPATAVARLRSEGGVVRVRFPIVGKVWVTTTQDLTGRMLKDNETFTLRRNGKVAGMRWWMPGLIRSFADNMLTMDEPDHKRLRSIVDEAFRRRAILNMEPHILALAAGLAGELFSEGSPADLVARYSRRLPLAVICELLGLPQEDRQRFMSWMEGLVRLSSAVGFLGLLPSLVSMMRYLERRLDEARERGGEGLIAELVRVEKEGGRINSREMVSMVFLLLGAGSETTTHLIAGSVFELLRNSERRDWLTADWNRAPLAVEEFLRFVSPVQFSKPRFVQKDIEFGGAVLRKGDRIMAMIVAANLDPAAHPEPDRLDLERAPNPHLSFGTGIHFCLGHQLARIEGQCALKALFERWPKLRLAVPEAQVRWRKRPGLRAIEALPVTAS
jgi:cytochrome P450 PksS